MIKGKKVLLLWGIAFCLLAPAFAHGAVDPIPNPSGYWDDPGTPAIESYGYNPTPTIVPPSGPHGGFTISTNSCRDCHAVHQAASSNKLLRYQTISDNCLYCHDATGGPVVGTPIKLLPDADVKASHYVSTTTIIGGEYNLTNPLTCTECHSVHNNPVRVLDTWEWFYCDNTSTASSHLLLKNPNRDNSMMPGFYGGYWCSDCHNLRMNTSSTIHNHPVNDSLRYTTAGLPGSTQQYFRMYPVETSVLDYRTSPICQHCHEDPRDCEAAFTHTYPTGGNPFYNTFPHESENRYFNVELVDDLCTNCHLADELP